MKIRTFIPLVMLTAFLSAVLFFAHLLKLDSEKKALPVLGQVADFNLTSAQGQTVSLQTLKGKVWIIDFIFTTCGSVCPVMTKNMAALHRSFAMIDDIRLVSVSVNPENDTPQVLKTFSEKYNANLDQWYFLTGAREDIQKLAVESFMLGSVEEPVFHSTRMVLVDRQGRIRALFDGTKTDEVNQLFNAAARLLKEKS